MLSFLLTLMPFMNDLLLDLPLQAIEDDADRMDICSQEPANYTEATSTFTLGNETTLAYTGPSDRTPNGRETEVDAITAGSVTATDTATHWALSKTPATSTLYCAGALSSSQGVTSGNTFTLTATVIGIPDAV